jgi:hypothetical protein
MMEYWNVGLRLVERTSLRAYASERILGIRSGKRNLYINNVESTFSPDIDFLFLS